MTARFTTETCLLQRWRAARLAEDQALEDGDTERPIAETLVIDPDIVCPPDLRSGPGPARSALAARMVELDQLGSAFAAKIESTAGWPAASEDVRRATLGGFLELSRDPQLRRRLVEQGLATEDDLKSPVRMLALAIAALRAHRPEPLLREVLQLTAAELEALERLLAEPPAQRRASQVTDALVTHHKRTRLYPKWKAEEIQRGLIVSGDHFVVAGGEPIAVAPAMSTGLDDAGRPLAVGALEPHWRVLSNNKPVDGLIAAAESGWLPNTERSQWIRAKGGVSVIRFDLNFSLRGFDPATATMKVRMASAQIPKRLLLNGRDGLIELKGAHPEAWLSFSLDGELVAGDNQLSLEIFTSEPTPLAVRFEIEVAGARSARAALTSRGSLAQRLAWDSKLAARVAQHRSLAGALAAACSIVDARELPALRDDLVRITGTGVDDPALALARRLLADVLVGPARLSSAAEHAGHTLQMLLHVLASGARTDSTFADFAVGNPLRLAVDARFLQSYDAWRAASLVFWYPENYLFPSLLAGKSASNAFRDWFSSIVVDGIEAPAAAGMTDIEARFGVPVQLALTRVARGDHQAALDALADVYDYRAREPRKWQHLFDEEKIATSFEREPAWFSTSLYPHQLAATRRNAYTRFLILTTARTLLDAGDAAQVEGDDTAIDRARFYYRDAEILLASIPPMGPPDPLSKVPDNPVVGSLRARVTAAAARLRAGVDLGGLSATNAENLEGGVVDVGADGVLRLVTSLPPPPTPYRYASLIARAKELVAIAQQIEAQFLASLEKKDVEQYTLMRARQDAEAAGLQAVVATSRIAEAEANVSAVRAREARLQVTDDHYRELLDSGPLESERRQAQELEAAAGLQVAASGVSAAASVASFIAAAHPVANALTLGKAGADSLVSGLNAAASALSSAAGGASTLASVDALKASFERRRQDWEFQRQLVAADQEANRADIAAASSRVDVASAELSVALSGQVHTAATVAFLGAKFTGAPLYEFMSRVLGDVYRHMLGLATSSARLAERQLAFERQEPVSGIIRTGYASVRDTRTGRDLRGLTGSARLLDDLSVLDQRAFDTTRRKLQLRRTISLARAFPNEFIRLRETGVLPFATPMEVFDRDFPGHYLRLINAVRLSVVALIPPNEGIRGNLFCPGASRVVVQNNGFRTIIQRRLPETVAFTSPLNATGMFDIDLQPDLLRPFEGLGVDTTWVFELPRPSNPFDYETLVDVLLTLDYTALYDAGLRRDVIRRLGQSVEAERTFSIRSRYPDVWYALQNPADDAPQVLAFDIAATDFAANHEDVRIVALTVFAVAAPGDGAPLELELSSLVVTGTDGARALPGARTFGGIVGTRRGNGAAWKPLEGRSPVGSWQFGLPDNEATRAALGRMQDLVVSISFRATLPRWPE